MAKTPHNLAELHYCAQEIPFYRTAVHTLVVSAMAQWKVPSPHRTESGSSSPEEETSLPSLCPWSVFLYLFILVN